MIQDYLRHLKYSREDRLLYLALCVMLSAVVIVIVALLLMGWLGCDPVAITDYFALAVGVAAAGICARI
jgi:hypothetical protein